MFLHCCRFFSHAYVLLKLLVQEKKYKHYIFLFPWRLTVKFCQISNTEHQMLTPNTGIEYTSLETTEEGFQCNSKHIYPKADLTEDAQNCILKQSQISCHCNKHCLEKCYKLYYYTVYQMLKSPDNERKGIILLTCQRYHLSPHWTI